MWNLVATALAIAIGLYSYVVMTPNIARYEARNVEDAAADKVKAMSDAAQQYVITNLAAVEANAASGPVILSAANLQTAGDLDTAFQDTNYWGQAHSIIIIQVGPQQLEMLAATCAGNTIPDGTLVRLAGEIKEDGAAILSINPTFASHGQKNEAIAPFANTTCPLTAGHLAAVHYFNGTQITPPYVNRFPQPGGSTEPATMHVDLQMNGFNLQGVQEAFQTSKRNADGSTAKMSQAVTGFSITTDGGTVAKTTCPSGAAPNAVAIPTGWLDAASHPDNGVWATVASASATTWIAHLSTYSQPTSGASGTTNALPTGTNSSIVILESCP